MLYAEWVVEATIPVVSKDALVRRYPQKEELGWVLGASLGVAEPADVAGAEALKKAV